MKKFLQKNKDAVVLIVAIVIPFGVVGLGVWKAVELVRDKNKEEKENGNTEDKSKRPLFRSETTS